MTHTPIDRIGYPKDDDNRAPHMLGLVFLALCLGYAVGIASACFMVAGL